MKISTKLTILLISVYLIVSIVSAFFVTRVLVDDQQISSPNYNSLLMVASFIIVFAGACVIISILLFCKKKIFQPLENLIESFERVSKGDLFHRIEITTSDEIGKLSEAFNDMTENLSNKVHEIRAINIKLDSSSRELGSRVERRTKELSDTVLKLKQEIEERKRAEERLYVMDLAIQQSIDGVVIAELDGSIRFANEAWAAMHGLLQDSFTGKHMSIFHTKEQFRNDVEPFLKEVKIKGGHEGEIGHIRSDGEIFFTWMSFTLLKDETGEKIGMMGIARDITDAKAVENELRTARIEAESANLAKSQFLANMSHEIRTPMNAIIGMTELALDTKLTTEQADYLNTLQGSSDSLLNLLNDILDLSKIEVGKLDVEYIEFDFRKSASEVVKNLVVQAQKKNIEIIFDVDWDIPSYIIGDPGRLRQILTNLIGNSIKFTEKGLVRLNISLVERACTDEKSGEQIKGPLMIKFSVSDTGIGIPANKQGVIFDKFTQTDSSITRKFGGTGLGLTISRQLVQLMGGDIWVNSPGLIQDPEGGGPGSTFCFTLPLRVPEGKKLRREPVDIEELIGVSALIVDDISINREIFTKMLKRWGMIPHSVPRGLEAIEVLNQSVKDKNPFQVVLMDIQMPEMSGFETIERIRSDDNISNTQIIVLTSGGLKGDGKRCRDMGVVAYLKKPIPSAQLLEAILMVKGNELHEKKEKKLITRFSLEESRKKLNILVAEDNLINQKLIHRVLEKKGFIVDIANNGRECVQKWGESTYDIILMDIQMPEMDGIESTMQIRKLEKEAGNSTIPIIALTAHAMKGDKERFLEAGMNNYISKPIKQAELMSAIEKLIFINS
jgi:PAS domain S-box-containing protein